MLRDFIYICAIGRIGNFDYGKNRWATHYNIVVKVKLRNAETASVQKHEMHLTFTLNFIHGET